MKLTKNGVVCTQKQGVENFATGEIFASIARFPFLLLGPAWSCLHFLHSWLDAIEDNSYELGVNQLNFDMPSLI